MIEPLSFWAIVYKVQTIATDNGIRVTLDLPETAIAVMAELAEYKRAGVVLNFTASPLQNNKEQDNALCEGSKWKSKWQTEEG